MEIQMTYEFVGNTMVPSEVLANDIEVNDRYPGFRVAYMPHGLKDAERAYYGKVKRPFAIVNETNGQVVKELTEDEAKNLNFILGWLYHNDTQRHGEAALWEEHKKKMLNANADKKAATREKLFERLEEAKSVYNSGKYTNILSDGRIVRDGVIMDPDRKTI